MCGINFYFYFFGGAADKIGIVHTYIHTNSSSPLPNYVTLHQFFNQSIYFFLLHSFVLSNWLISHRLNFFFPHDSSPILSIKSIHSSSPSIFPSNTATQLIMQKKKQPINHHGPQKPKKTKKKKFEDVLGEKEKKWSCFFFLFFLFSRDRDRDQNAKRTNQPTKESPPPGAQFTV